MMGNLRHSVTIEKNTEVLDAAGSPKDSWSAFATVFARLEPLTGRELYAAQQFSTALSHKVTIHYLVGVIPKMRISFGTRRLNILSVENMGERNRFMSLMCEERSREQ